LLSQVKVLIVSSSSSILSSIFSVVVKLTSEFTSLKEPTNDLASLQSRFILLTDPILSDLRGKLNPRNQRESLGFQTSGPSPDPSLQTPE
jgi:hypothetical protein